MILRLSTFLRDNSEQILAEWEAFAHQHPGGDATPVLALRDHAQDMLGAIARDLDVAQTALQQTDKAHGRSDAGERGAPTAAQEHGAGRAESGFTAEQMVSEFRALRASVLRLWAAHQKRAAASDLEDITRFNEAIDQAIAEALARYTRDINQSKERFLAILGHDLRTPLGAIITSSRFVLDIGELPETSLTLLTQIERSARRMNQMVADLVEFTRTRFGDVIPMVRVEMDLRQMVTEVVAEVAASYPACQVETTSSGELTGKWDWDRIHQALTNVLSNAVQHGDVGRPIHVQADGEANEVVLSVQNYGRPIPSDQLVRLFDAVKEAGTFEPQSRGHLGLGLYIVDKIVAAHGGSIQVHSTAEEGTTVTIRLPRKS